MTSLDELKAFFLADGETFSVRVPGEHEVFAIVDCTNDVRELVAECDRVVANNDELEAIRDHFTKREPLVQKLIEAAATYDSHLAQAIAVELRDNGIDRCLSCGAELP